ncbi:hypothetical protein [Actinoplanes sp. NBRC 103695]|uniref:hypothetical protein n=1 Tax=Actinoplanes sp. NBRC 103695 TaxID=3032202 RepID=UPI0025548AA4|nr:hypothetical protein [Actinoplanes sp. NBRC 103695]
MNRVPRTIRRDPARTLLRDRLRAKVAELAVLSGPNAAWAWARVTHGDFIFSPQTRPNGRRPRGDRELAHYIQHRWQHICHRNGTYAWLRQRLTSYTDELIAQLDAETDQ